LAPLEASAPPTARQWVVAPGGDLVIASRVAHRGADRRRGDDPRYARLREKWGAEFRGRLFSFLQIQAARVLALSILVAARNGAGIAPQRLAQDRIAGRGHPRRGTADRQLAGPGEPAIEARL
jgi:hypothetical protein